MKTSTTTILAGITVGVIAISACCGGIGFLLGLSTSGNAPTAQSGDPFEAALSEIEAQGDTARRMADIEAEAEANLRTYERMYQEGDQSHRTRMYAWALAFHRAGIGLHGDHSTTHARIVAAPAWGECFDCSARGVWEDIDWRLLIAQRSPSFLRLVVEGHTLEPGMEEDARREWNEWSRFLPNKTKERGAELIMLAAETCHRDWAGEQSGKLAKGELPGGIRIARRDLDRGEFPRYELVLESEAGGYVLRLELRDVAEESPEGAWCRLMLDFTPLAAE